MKKHVRNILVPSLTALAFGVLSIGTTFALFTSEAKTKMNIESGKLNVAAAISNFRTYSAEAHVGGDRIDENQHEYISKQTAVNGVFTNGGEASYENSQIALQRITPGDRITFDVSLSDDANISFKYRIVYKVTSQDNSLAKALVTKTDIYGGQEETYSGLLELTSCWEEAQANDLDDLEFSFDIELPIDKGNYYQEKEVEFALAIEAVQGNAYTDNEGAKVLTGIEDMAQQSVAEAGEPLVIEVADGEGQEKEFGVTATIPADLIEAGKKVELLVSDAEMDVDTSAKATLDFDITLKVNDVAVSSFDQAITVEIYVGEGLDITRVLHDGNPIANYSYDEDTGIITFTTTSFSPFVVEYKMPITGGGESMIEEEEEF